MTRYVRTHPLQTCAFLLLSLVWVGCPSEDPGPIVVAPPPPQAVARLVSREGTVTLTRAGQTSPAEPGPLQENDVIETGPASKALLRAPGGREIELGENTRFKVGKNLEDVEVTEGTISFLASDEADGGVVQVTTKFGKTTVAPGTRATLALGDDGLSVDVSVGAITQLGDDGGTRNVGAGQKLEFGVGAIEVVDPGTAPKELELQLVSEGRVLVKKKGDAKFTPAKKGAQVLPAGSALQVAQGGKAKLVLEGLTLKVPGGVNASVEGTVAGDDGNEATVALTGPAQLALDGKAKAGLRLSGKVPFKVRDRGEAAATVNKSRVEVQLGEVEVESNGKKAVVKAGEVANVTGSGIEVAQRPRPLITLPIAKKVRVYAKRGLGEIALELPEQPSRVQVANDAQFTDVVVAGPAKDQVVVPAPGSGELHWRALDDKGEPTAIGRARFLPDVGSTKEEASRGDVVAETGLKAMVYFQSAVPTLTFTFPVVEGAKGYRLRVYRSKDLSTPIVDKKTTETKATVDPGVLSEGSYRWSATALDDAGNEKVGGRMNQMDIIFDNSLTSLQLASPRDGDRADGAKASGVAPLGSKLFVNGKPVATDGSGRFNAPLPKSELVVFRLVTQDGSESYWFRRLKK